MPSHEIARIEIRPSNKQLLLIKPGLQQIIANYRLLMDVGVSPNCYPSVVYNQLRFNRGKFNQRMMELVLALWTKLYPYFGNARHPSSRHRLRLNFVEVAACMFAARQSLTLIRHGHITTSERNLQRTGRQLRKTFEKFRKRAKRKLIAEAGVEAYKAAEEGWHRLQRWIRVNLTFCACGRRIVRGAKHRQQIMIEQFMDAARSYLRGKHKRIPTPKELRSLIRLALAYVRRGRTIESIRVLASSSRFAERYFGEFVEQRIAKPRK